MFHWLVVYTVIHLLTKILPQLKGVLYNIKVFRRVVHNDFVEQGDICNLCNCSTSRGLFCWTRGNLSVKGTFCRTRGHFCRTRGHLVKISLWPQQASGARYEFGNTSKTWRQPILAYMQSFIEIGLVGSENKRDIVRTDLLIYYMILQINCFDSPSSSYLFQNDFTSSLMFNDIIYMFFLSLFFRSLQSSKFTEIKPPKGMNYLTEKIGKNHGGFVILCATKWNMEK